MRGVDGRTYADVCFRPDDDDYRPVLHPARMAILTTTWQSHVDGCTWTLENNGFSMPTTTATAYEPGIRTFYTCSTSHVALVLTSCWLRVYVDFAWQLISVFIWCLWWRLQ